MRLCANKDCNAPIEHLHKNYKTCISCHKKPETITIPKDATIEISFKLFRELEKFSAIGKKLTTKSPNICKEIIKTHLETLTALSNSESVESWLGQLCLQIRREAREKTVDELIVKHECVACGQCIDFKVYAYCMAFQIRR